MPQNPDDPYGLGLRPLGGNDNDDPYNLGLRPLGQDTGGGFGSGYGLPSLRDIGTTAAKIPIQLGETLVGLGDIATGGYLGKGLDYLGYDPGMLKSFIDSYESPELTAAKKQLAQAQGFGGTASALWQNPGLAALTLEESLPYLAGGAGIARGAMRAAPALSRLGASMIGEGVIGAGTQAAQIRESQGDFDWSDSPYAAGSGALTGLISGGAGRVANKFGLPDIDTMLADKAVRGVRRIPALMGGGLAEAGEETLQSGQEQAGLNLATGKPVGQNVPQAMTTGGLAGFLMGSTVPAFRSPSAPYSPVGEMGGMTQQDLPYAGLRVPEPRQPPSGLEHEGPMYGPEIGPYGIPNPNQGDLPFNIDPEGQGMLFEDAGPKLPFQPPKPPPPATPPSGGGGEGINLNITDPNIIPPGTTLSDNQQVVTIIAPDQNNVAFWKNRGYVPVAGLVDANGKPQLVRGDVAPLFVTGDKRPAAPPPQPPAAPGAIGEGQTGIAPGEDHVVPNQVADQTGYKENMEKGGYGVALRTATHTTFREFPQEPAFQKTEGPAGPMDPEQVRYFLSRMLGRDPTDEEIQAVISRQARPGDTTGRVAQFEKPTDLTYPFDNQELLNQYLTLSERLDTWPRGVEGRPDLIDNANRMQAELIRRGWNPQTGQFPGVPTDTTPYSNKLGLTTRPVPPRLGYGPGTEGPPDYSQGPSGQPPEQAQGGRIAGAFPAPLGPRIPVEGFDVPAPQPPGGQGQLMPGIVQNRLQNIANAPPPEGPIDLGPQPFQQDLYARTEGPTHAQLVETLYQRAREMGVNPDDYRSLGELEDALDNGDPGAFRRTPGLPSEGGDVLLGPDDYDDEPAFQRNYDPRIGGDEYQRSRVSFKDALANSSTEELVAMRRAMAGNLDKLKIEIGDFVNSREATGMAKRRIIFAENKLANIDEELSRRRDEEPSFAKVEGGGLKASVNVMNAIENITRDYTGKLSGIMNREGMQNAMDAAELVSGGTIRVRFNDTDKIMEINDNGPGLDEDTLAYKLVEVFSSGKSGEAGATGGKGIGSAAYIYGGARFKIRTVAVDAKDGKKYKIVAGGTPQQFLVDPNGSDWSKVEVSPETKTGTTIEVTLKDNQDITDSRDMLEKILTHSRNRNSRVIVDMYGGTGKTPLSRIEPDGHSIREYKFTSDKADKMIGDFTTVNRNSDVKILIPTFDPSVSRSDYMVHYLNNGMYQYSKQQSLYQMADGVPDNVIVDIHPLVDDIDELYPFINTREAVKNDIADEVETFVKEHISKPGISRRKNRTQELYDAMSTFPMPKNAALQNTKRKPLIYDPGNRFTPEEMQSLIDSPVIQELIRTYDSIIDEILISAGRANWISRLEGVGLFFDPDTNGIHIPNPTTGKTSILINPFVRIQQGMPAAESAWRNTITNLHEVAHIGSEGGLSTNFQFSEADKKDPRLLEFFTALHEQSQIHGDTGYQDTGHGVAYSHRLAEVFSRYGIQKTYDTAARLESIFTGRPRERNFTPTGRQPRGYSPEIQRILQLYTESRRRPPVVEDLLSRTGVKQRNRGQAGANSIPGNNPNNGAGTPWGRVKQATGWGTGGAVTQKDKEFNWVKEALAVPTNATTMLDLSAPGRQGLTMIATPEFWKATWAMFKGLSYDSYKEMDKNLKSKPLMRRRIGPDGRIQKSFGEEIGVKLFSPASEPGPRAEATASRWLEMGIGRTTKDAAGNKKWEPTTGSKLWQHSPMGYGIRATNRAFITFLNHLNVNRTEKLLNLARDMSIRGVNTGRTAMPGLLGGIHLQGGENLGFTQKVSKEEAENLNPYHNLVLAKEIAEFVNTATGHGPLKTHYLPFKQTELNLEKHADLLGKMLFSPGLLASRARMMNPSTYIMASPFVRQQYAKAALSTAAAWFIYTQLLKYAAGPEAEIGDDITSADFGKVRVGDTRLDLGGGFLQFATAYGRAYMGGSTSSSSGEFHRFGSGYQAQTQEDMMERFMVNKLNPVAKFAWDVYSASEYNPFHVGDRTAQLFVPLFIQDLNEIAKENPDLLPIFGPSAFFGGGTQVYSKGESVAKLIPEERDWLTTGGGLRDLAPWNWGNDPGEESRPFPWSER